VRCRILEGALQRSVADQELGVRFLAERKVLGLRDQHLGQDDGRGALGRDRDAAHLLKWAPGDELDRVDRALRADAEPREQPESLGVPRPLDR
jgi:hypothetical protein